MTKFLWTIDLAATLCLTAMIIIDIVQFHATKNEDNHSNSTMIVAVITCSLSWAVWYMYYLK